MLPDSIERRRRIIDDINHNHSKNSTCVRRVRITSVCIGYAIRQPFVRVLHNERQRLVADDVLQLQQTHRAQTRQHIGQFHCAKRSINRGALCSGRVIEVIYIFYRDEKRGINCTDVPSNGSYILALSALG